MEGDQANLRQQTLPRGDELSPQQQKLLRCFARGKTDEQIAKEFGCHETLCIAASVVQITDACAGPGQVIRLDCITLFELD